MSIPILLEKAFEVDANTTVYRDKLYPVVKNAMDNPSVRTAYKKLINDFISSRTEGLFDIIPSRRLVCLDRDMDKLFDVVGIKKSFVAECIKESYYGNIKNFSPLCAKHEFTVLELNIIRYFVLQKTKQETELSMLYLSFSGKFYPSLHTRYFRYMPAEHVLEYVVNNLLSKKFDLIACGNIIGAVKSQGNTWLSKYEDKFNNFSDEDVKYLLDQLLSRIASFLKNIANEYYKAYEDKDSFIAYSTDSYEKDDYHIADSNSLKVSKAAEKAINNIIAKGVDYSICEKCSDENISPSECRAVIESIMQNRENIIEVRELVTLLVSLYFSSGGTSLTNIDFITYTIAPKPNAKQKEIVRSKEIIENWLSESGTAYLRRRSRIATKNSYERAVRMYFALVIHNSSR